MSRAVRYILLFMLLLPVACRKEVGDENERGLAVTFEAMNATSPWKSGDKISLIAFKAPEAAGNQSSRNVVNFSTYRFTAASEGTKVQFGGRVPALDGTIPSGEASLYGIFPATNLSVSSVSQAASYSGKDYVYYILSGPSIASRQDGTGWRYCCFASMDGRVSVPGRSITRAPSFSLVNALVKFRFFSGKPVVRIDIHQENKSTPGLAGAFSLFTCATAVADGCQEQDITISNGGKPLPEELYFACGALAADVLLTFKFTTQDGSNVSRAVKITETCAPGMEGELPAFDLSEWTSAELAAQAAKNMGMGINVSGMESVTPTTEALPDRADASGMHILDRTRPVTYETNSANDPITQTTMNFLKSSGFSSIRLPITWFNHMGPPVSPEGVIDQVWLEHVKEVVDMARNAGLYVVINVHHDAGTPDYCWLKADWANYASVSAQLKNIWTQIAGFFKDCDYHLLFEGYNEICDELKTWWAPKTSDGFKAANALNQDFVDAVRATGGNNAVRNLIVSTYTSSEWEEGLAGFVLPEDVTDGHLIVQVHSYRPNEFVTARTVGDRSRLEFYESEKGEIDEMFERVQRYILDKGWPCFMGEYGAFSKKDAAGNRNELGRAEHAYYYTTRALLRGIIPMYWYNPSGYRERDEGRWTYPITAQGLMDAWKDFVAGTVVYKKYNHDAAYPIGQ